MKTEIKVIGLCGVAQSGKDTFCDAARRLFLEQDIIARRLSFADALKSDTDEFLQDKVGVSAFTTDLKEKTLIRDFLVAYGTKLMRKKDENCWIKKVESQVKRNMRNDEVTIITDVRYPNELDWVQNTLKGKCLHLSRTAPDGKIVAPANQEEKIYDPLLKKQCNHSLTWLTTIDQDVLDWIVRDELDSLFETPARLDRCKYE